MIFDLWKNARTVQILVLLALGGALAFAHAVEYYVGLKPCILCLYQRYVMIAAAGVGVITLMRGMGWGMPLQLVILLMGVGIAGYHAGVEEHLWPAPMTCRSNLPVGELSFDALKRELSGQPFIPCDRVAWRILGLSATLYSLALFLGLAGFIGGHLWLRRRQS